jgi:dienelactone hydrolase
MLIGALALLTHRASAEETQVFTQKIDYEVDGKSYSGFLAYPEQGGNGMGVIVVHEWWGLNDYARSRTEQLAKLGYTAFAVDMFGEGKTTADPKQAGEWAGQVYGNRAFIAKMMTHAIDFVGGQKTVQPGNVVAMGYCFGGTIVLESARAGLPLKGVVSFHGSLTTQAPAKQGEVKAKVLVEHGDADPMVTAEHVQQFEAEMKAAGVDYKINRYPDAVHSFTNPNAGKAGIEGVAYNKEADQKSWAAMQAFFKSLNQ